MEFARSHIEQDGASLVEFTLSPEVRAVAEAAVKEIAGGYEINPPCRTPMNKVGFQHRWIQMRSNDSLAYFYSGSAAFAQPMTPSLTTLMQIVNQTVGAAYNAALINKYAPCDYISAHSDSEGGLDKQAGVFMISLGAERSFRITKNQSAVEEVCVVRTKHCQALQMRGAKFQSRYKHGVAAEKRAVGDRISITFRCHDPSKDAAQMEKYEKGIVAKYRKEHPVTLPTLASAWGGRAPAVEQLAPGVEALIDHAVALNTIPLADPKVPLDEPGVKKRKLEDNRATNSTQ